MNENHWLDDDSSDDDDFYNPMLNSTLRKRKVFLEYTLRNIDYQEKEEKNGDSNS